MTDKKPDKVITKFIYYYTKSVLLNCRTIMIVSDSSQRCTASYANSKRYHTNNIASSLKLNIEREAGLCSSFNKQLLYLNVSYELKVTFLGLSLVTLSVVEGSARKTGVNNRFFATQSLRSQPCGP